MTVSHAGSIGVASGATRFGADCGAQDRDPRAAPAPRDPVGERDDVGGRAVGRDREHARAGAPVRLGLDVVGDDPAAHAPAVQRDAHDRADAHQRRERVGNRVVEDALDRGDDPGATRQIAGTRASTPVGATPTARAQLGRRTARCSPT